ncbi:NADH-ubiquinone oxidoreductase complex I, 21 kDa subunit-domain-containing protein [Jimgerdemannia flammicorona]|uniref:NADH-ubiquinone oxidoreductase complex I, 21 kDa subunit-domain-containing protein n=1 Tax=Jimgerdemannia flammicorona TaxID=994334 RepID=A0A433PGA5_9FUNG|nr:NADH-ubiquinone oxidoreductase complex I, 21 kDa subunit-domain-containing protein [Jimgerdemannia flammicorona]
MTSATVYPMSQLLNRLTKHRNLLYKPRLRLQTPFPVIDTDPHFFRVVRYFRPSDYVAWAAGTAIAPGLLVGLERLNPTPGSIRSPLKLVTFLGAIGGFMYAYQNSSRMYH